MQIRPQNHDLLSETIDTADGQVPVEAGSLPVLTIACHPDARRVGETAVLYGLASGNDTALSRLEPLFSHPGHAPLDPIADAFVSRSPVWLRPVAHDRLELDPCGGKARHLLVGGAPLDCPRQVTASEMDRGIVIELARRVVLILHLGTPRPSLAPRAGLVGDSEAIERVRIDIKRVSDLSVPILLRGETGTGKELIARALHAAGPRRAGPFISVNMAAIPPSTAASALFGHQRGAFTGAERSHIGYFEQADGGTIFLDEVGDMPHDIQVMLLRVLENGEIQPVGAERKRDVDVRFIAASDADLEGAVATGKFRAPLLHRLSGFELSSPPLRRRRDDIGRLLVHFLRLELESANALELLTPPVGRERPWLPAKLVAGLLRYSWPGNVRELHNVARQIVVAGREHACAPSQEILSRLKGSAASTETADLTEQIDKSNLFQKRRVVAEITEEQLTEALAQNGWRPKAAAEALGISRTTVYALIERSPNLRTVNDVPQEELRRVYAKHGGDMLAMQEELRIAKRSISRRVRELGIGQAPSPLR